MTPSGFPHSEIPGSTLACSSPRLIAACHVLHRRLVPRHPPCALYYLTDILLTASFGAFRRWAAVSVRSAYESTLHSPRLARLELHPEYFVRPTANGWFLLILPMSAFSPKSRHNLYRHRHLRAGQKSALECLNLRLSLSRPQFSNSMMCTKLSACGTSVYS